MTLARGVGWIVTLAVLGMLALALYVAAQLYVPEVDVPRRSLAGTASQVALVATLPRTPEFAGYDDSGEPVQFDLGYSYRELSLLWMPFAAYADQRFVLFSATGARTSMTPLTDIDRAAIVKIGGTDLTKTYQFPLYAHIWGWLVVLATVVAISLIARRTTRPRHK